MTGTVVEPSCCSAFAPGPTAPDADVWDPFWRWVATDAREIVVRYSVVGTPWRSTDPTLVTVPP